MSSAKLHLPNVPRGRIFGGMAAATPYLQIYIYTCLALEPINDKVVLYIFKYFKLRLAPTRNNENEVVS